MKPEIDEKVHTDYLIFGEVMNHIYLNLKSSFETSYSNDFQYLISSRSVKCFWR